MTTPSDSLKPLLFSKQPWIGLANPIWLASTVSLFRNIEKFKFPGKLSIDRKKQIISLVSKDLLSKELIAIGDLKNPALIKAEEIGILEKDFLGEHFLSTQNFNQAHAGEGFVLDETGTFLATLNMKDHIHLQLIDCHGEIENTWARLVKMEAHLGKSLNYSFMSKFGFLTADPAQCGTALIVTVYLHLPALMHTNKIDTLLEELEDESLVVSGFQGDPQEIIGDILMVQNNYTLGLTEENILATMRSFVTKIVAEETNARNQVKREDSADLKDRVSRAYGILIHSYQIEAIEALNALSLLKMGISAGWVTGMSDAEVNALFFTCRRAHLLQASEKKFTPEEMPHQRAACIHNALKNVKLLIQ